MEIEDHLRGFQFGKAQPKPPRYILRKEAISVEAAKAHKAIQIAYKEAVLEEARESLKEAQNSPLTLFREWQEEIPYGHPEWDLASTRFSPKDYAGMWSWANIPNGEPFGEKL